MSSYDNRIDNRFEILLLETAEEYKERKEKERLEYFLMMKNIEELGVCEGVFGLCTEKNGVKWVDARTQYEWDGEGENPNRELFLCPNCAEIYNDHWDEMWNYYYHRGLI